MTFHLRFFSAMLRARQLVDDTEYSLADVRVFNIDAKINGAYIVMGLLYGKRDLDQTIIISTRASLKTVPPSIRAKDRSATASTSSPAPP